MPKLCVVTPSFHQGRFIGRTIESVLSQAIPDLDYLVMDGGSQDETLEVLRSFEPQIRWVSEPDRGHADALNKAMVATDGEIIGWLNSDDIYLPGALERVLGFFERNPEVDVVYGNAYHIDEQDRILERYPTEPWNAERLWESCFLCQPATFFRRRVIEECGLLDTEVQVCIDYEYWLRLYQKGMRFAYLRAFLAGSRLHPATKTLGQPIKAHVDANRMLERKLGTVPDRWLKNWSHVLVRTRFDLPEPSARFILLVTAFTWIAAFRWNGSITPELRQELADWLRMGAELVRNRERPALESSPAVSVNRRPPRIGIDVSQTGGQAAGCGLFAEQMVRSLSSLDEAGQYLLYPTFGPDYEHPEGPEATLEIEAPNFSRLPLRDSHDRASELWRLPGPDLEQRLGHPDIVHANNFFCPENLEHARLVYTLYDMAFVSEPDWTTERNRQICFEGVFRASQHADLILAISEATRQDFLDLFPRYPQHRVLVARPASRFEELADEQRPDSLPALVPDGFLFHVGTREPRKNQLRLLRAYADYAHQRDEALPLVLAGGRGWLQRDLEEEARRLGVSDRIRDLGYVEEHVLHWLYRHCRLFAFPSLSEGWGLPVAEALSQGSAVLTSDTGALPEVAGDAAWLVDPTDTAAIRQGIETLLHDPKLREDLQDRSRRQARRFTLEGLAEAVHGAYRQVLEWEKYRADPVPRDRI